MYKYEDEIDFKDVLTNPRRWFGLYYLLLIVGIVLGGVYYLKNINSIYMNSVNNSVYMPDSVDVDEASAFMISTAQKDIFTANVDKAAIIRSAIYDIDKVHSNKNWYSAICNTEKAVTSLANSIAWKGNKELFTKLIISNIGQNGFNSNYTELSNMEVDDLYNTLLGLL